VARTHLREGGYWGCGPKTSLDLPDPCLPGPLYYFLLCHGWQTPGLHEADLILHYFSGTTISPTWTHTRRHTRRNANFLLSRRSSEPGLALSCALHATANGPAAVVSSTFVYFCDLKTIVYHQSRATNPATQTLRERSIVRPRFRFQRLSSQKLTFSGLFRC
jgi:hypothetical protein